MDQHKKGADSEALEPIPQASAPAKDSTFWVRYGLGQNVQEHQNRTWDPEECRNDMAWSQRLTGATLRWRRLKFCVRHMIRSCPFDDNDDDSSYSYSSSSNPSLLDGRLVMPDHYVITEGRRCFSWSPSRGRSRSRNRTTSPLLDCASPDYGPPSGSDY